MLRDDYTESDSDQACAAGERATTHIGKNGQNKAAIFRFNPGKAQKVFPPKHPYYKVPEEAKKEVKEIVETQVVSTKPNKEQKQQIRNTYENFVKTLPELKVGNDISHQKDIVTRNNDTIRVSRKFFSETFSKSKSNKLLQKTIEVAIEFDEWMPKLTNYTIESGVHHDCQFAVFRTNYKDVEIELKAMIFDGILKAYHLRIK